MSLEAAERPSVEEIQKNPEYKSKLQSCVEDALNFAERVKAVAGGSPTEADIKQLRDEYAKISESALIAHDSIPDDTNYSKSERGSHLQIKGTDGDFLATIRIKLFEALGDGDYGRDTPARKFFEDEISPRSSSRGLFERRDRVYP